jgi:hypothetical protein
LCKSRNGGIHLENDVKRKIPEEIDIDNLPPWVNKENLIILYTKELEWVD